MPRDPGQPLDLKPSTDHLMQSMALGYQQGRGKMDGRSGNCVLTLGRHVWSIFIFRKYLVMC